MLNSKELKTIQKLGLKQTSVLAKGMECLVFDNGDGTITKVYEEKFGLDYVNRLKQFYDSLDTRNVSFKVPQIIDTRKKGEYILVTEALLNGKVFKISELGGLIIGKVNRLLDNYVDVLFLVKEIKTQFLKPAEPLNLDNKFVVNGGIEDWNTLLRQSLLSKPQKTLNSLTSDADGFQEKLNMLSTYFLQPYHGEYSLVHGDFFLGNILFDNDSNVNAVLDFGILTVMGDFLFDVATGWIFIDMYREVKTQDLKSMVWNRLEKRLSSEESKLVHRYVLTYSILSCDMYSSACDDGHYAWCVDNLNNEDYWLSAQ